MTKEFDPIKSYMVLKAQEKIIAFVGFHMRLDEKNEVKEGIIKISSFYRPYGGGYLTLTFIIDKEKNEGFKTNLDRLFSNLTDESLRPYLGNDFERVVKVSLDSLAKVRQWIVEEINLYFHKIEGLEKMVIEDKVLPALEVVLACAFEPVEWWPQKRPASEFAAKAPNGQISLKELFRNWFGL